MFYQYLNKFLSVKTYLVTRSLIFFGFQVIHTICCCKIEIEMEVENRTRSASLPKRVVFITYQYLKNIVRMTSILSKKSSITSSFYPYQKTIIIVSPSYKFFHTRKNLQVVWDLKCDTECYRESWCYLQTDFFFIWKSHAPCTGHFKEVSRNSI